MKGKKEHALKRHVYVFPYILQIKSSEEVYFSHEMRRQFWSTSIYVRFPGLHREQMMAGIGAVLFVCLVLTLYFSLSRSDGQQAADEALEPARQRLGYLLLLLHPRAWEMCIRKVRD